MLGQPAKTVVKNITFSGCSTDVVRTVRTHGDGSVSSRERKKKVGLALATLTETERTFRRRDCMHPRRRSREGMALVRPRIRYYPVFSTLRIDNAPPTPGCGPSNGARAPQPLYLIVDRLH